MCDALYLSRYPNQDLEIAKNTWRATVQEVEEKISTAQVLLLPKCFQMNVYFP